VFGSYRIQATTPDELSEIGQFLREGFNEPPDISYFTEPALRWKYFEPCGIDFGPRSYVARASGRIVGHVGIVPRAFLVHAGSTPTGPIPASHFIDVLASPDFPSAGLMLMKRGFGADVVQYALGGTADWQRLAEKIGYERRFEFPVYRAILRPLYRARIPGTSASVRLLRVGADLTKFLTHPGQKLRRSVTIRRVTAFGSEVGSLIGKGPSPQVLTSRPATLLNYFLRYPAGTISGWSIQEGSNEVGLALLNVHAENRDHQHGTIVECCLASSDQDLWHAAIVGLERKLKDQGADVATCYASTSWLDQACRRAGFLPLKRQVPFLVRDLGGLLPRDIPYHLTSLEADHAFI
jgi:hypothetical protein